MERKLSRNPRAATHTAKTGKGLCFLHFHYISQNCNFWGGAILRGSNLRLVVVVKFVLKPLRLYTHFCTLLFIPFFEIPIRLTIVSFVSQVPWETHWVWPGLTGAVKRVKKICQDSGETLEYLCITAAPVLRNGPPVWPQSRSAQHWMNLELMSSGPAALLALILDPWYFRSCSGHLPTSGHQHLGSQFSYGQRCFWSSPDSRSIFLLHLILHQCCVSPFSSFLAAFVQLAAHPYFPI